MGEKVITTAVCPKCGRFYHGRSALSRVDNQTFICPDCGTREALTSIGVDADEQEQILQTIHQSGCE
jgi:transposase-like protein